MELPSHLPNQPVPASRTCQRVLEDRVLGEEASHHLDRLKILIDVSDTGATGYQCADWLRANAHLDIGMSDQDRVAVGWSWPPPGIAHKRSPTFAIDPEGDDDFYDVTSESIERVREFRIGGRTSEVSRADLTDSSVHQALIAERRATPNAGRQERLALRPVFGHT